MFSLKLVELFKLVTMGNFTLENLYPFEIWNNRIGIMTCCNSHIIKILNCIFIFFKIGIPNLKFANIINIFNVSRNAVEFNIFSKSLFFKPFHKISFKNISWKICRNRLSKMLFESIVRELKTFLWKVGPKFTIHT